jgi:hypothetical protein
MPSVLLILSSYDIAAAIHMAEGLGEDYRTWYFDPTLTEDLAASPLRRPELVLPDEVLADYAGIDSQARALAAALEDEVAAALQPLTGDVSLRGWQALNLYYFFIGHLWYSRLWDGLRERFGGAAFHLPFNDNPANFYWPSFMPALLLKERLEAWGIACHAVAYGERADESDIVPNLAGQAGQHYDVLTHLPTCFYDAPYFAAELQAAGKRSIDIEPKYWGVPLQPDTHIKMTRVDHAELAALGLPSVMPHGEQLLHLLHRLLQPYIATHEFCARQALHLAKLYQSQLVTLQLLERYFGDRRPGQFLLSDHDAGYHGPLLSYARRHHIPVLQLPHAKVSISSDFSSNQLTALSHPMQGLPMQRADGRQLRRYPLAYPESYSGDSSSRPLRRVGILLSGISLNGVLSTRPGPYVDGIARIAAWCRRHGIELAIRNRPGQPLYQPIAERAGLSRQVQEAGVACTLQQFVQSVDLCLMYDAPTSAAIECLRNQVPILNPLVEPLSPAEVLWADPVLIPRADLDATLSRLNQFRLDEDVFNQFRRRQFADYLSASAEAPSLRHYQ